MLDSFSSVAFETNDTENSLARQAYKKLIKSVKMTPSSFVYFIVVASYKTKVWRK